MSPHEAPATTPREANETRYYPVYPIQYHPEFGYLAPTIRLRRKVSLLIKGAAFGTVVGAVAAIAMLPDPETRVMAALSIQTQAAPGELRPEPVAFVAPALALPAAARGARALSPALRTAAVPEAAAVAVPAAAIAVPVTAKAPPKPRKKVTRRPQPPRDVRADEPEPRNAYAGPFRGTFGDQRRSFEERRPFGFGW